MTTVLVLKAAEHPIKSVTIFNKSSRAEVVRTFKLDLTKGQNKVEIKGLSNSIDTHSVRVSGLGDARLHDVVCTIEQSQNHGFSAGGLGDSYELTRSLNVKKNDIEKRKAMRESEAQLLTQYAQSLSAEHVPPPEVLCFMDNYITQNTKILEAIAALDESLVKINREIADELKNVKAKKGFANGRVDVVVAADADVQIDLVLTYIVSNATWQPTYELHAQTEGGKPSSLVKLQYRARINQSTGEDWVNTFLTLSTVSGGASRDIPSLKPLKLRPKAFGVQHKPTVAKAAPNQFVQPRINANPGGLFSKPAGGGLFGSTNNMNNAGTSTGFGAFGGTNPPPFNVNAIQVQSTGFSSFQPLPQQQLLQQHQQQQQFQQQQQQYQPQIQLPQQQQQEVALNWSAPLADEDEDDFEEVDETSGSSGSFTATPITEPTTIVNETPVAVTFSVQGQSTIPTDGVDHQVTVAILPFESTISYITVPRLDPRVYLQCRVKNTSDYRLLPGAVRVIFDDSFVSSTRITNINAGENFECTLGDDASTKVTYSRTLRNVKSSGGAFAETTNTTTYFTKITIHNKHAFDIDDLIVRDVIPVCEDKRGQVILRKPEGLAKAEQGQTISLQEGLKVTWSKPDSANTGDSKAEERDGIFEWKWRVSGGAKVTLEAEWDAKVPGDDAWAEVTTIS